MLTIPHIINDDTESGTRPDTLTVGSPGTRPATEQDIMDLEMDLHSVKTLHGYTKQEHAVTVNKLAKTEAKLNEATEKLERFEKHLQALELEVKSLKSSP